MTQALHSQCASIALMDVYRRQTVAEHLQPLLPAKRSRNRGMILSSQGWQKLVQAGVLCNEFGERHTYQQLSERSHLDERTISRLLSCEVKVDKSTIKAFFQAFNLPLEADDYTLPNSNKTGIVASEMPAYTDSAKSLIQVKQLIEELTQLKQRIREYEHLFHRLGLNENQTGQQLRA